MKLESLVKIALVSMAIMLSQLSYAETVWIDVRSSVEHSLNNIEGDVHIAYADIAEEVARLYPDKTTEIHLYCQSGGRADKAKVSLEDAGYTNVVNSGGVSDARKERGIDQ
jgi:phage shock protein E